MSSLGCPVMAAVLAARGCQQAVFAQLRRGRILSLEAIPMVKLRSPK